MSICDRREGWAGRGVRLKIRQREQTRRCTYLGLHRLLRDLECLELGKDLCEYGF